MNRKVIIESLGGQGDGIAKIDGKQVYIPYSVTGDEIDIKLQGNKARIKHIHKKSQYRTDPICNHYTKCGGCTVQHLQNEYYKEWKTRLLKTALLNQGINDVVIEPLKISPAGSRRRASFQAVGKNDGSLMMGYAEKGSHNIIDVSMCPILVPEIVGFLAPLKKFLASLLSPKQKIMVQITSGDNGLDVVFKSKGEVNLKLRMDLAEFAEKTDIARISWFDTSLKTPYYEMLAERRKPYVLFKGKKVFFPEGSFLQATYDGQEALISEMLKAIEGANNIIDLFSGCGTFSISAALFANVHAVENNEDMLLALKNSANMMQGMKSITTELRDLFLRPILPHELNRYDVVIIDPPRAGAKYQIDEIIQSDIKKLVMISCNPVTFARDAQALIDAKFRMSTVTPVDQFLYTSHLELIAVFTR